jgi:pimeloyl-ACP methyl ester carboxylesterase
MNVLRAYGDGTLFGEPYGEGPVRVVFLHGWARRGGDFAACATELAARGVASVALDLPGFGSSPDPTVAGGARHYATLVAPALAEMSDDPLVLVGHSFGGRVATVLAADHPALVRALVLTGVPLVRLRAASKPPWRYRVTRFKYARGWVSEKRMEKARQRYGSTDYRNARGVIRDVLVANVNESYEEELARVRVPVAMIWGELDREVPEEVAARATELLETPHTFHRVAGVGHFVPNEAPNEIVSAVEELLA